MQTPELAPNPLPRGQSLLWHQRLEELRVRYPDREAFRDAAHRMLRWSAIESDVTLYVEVRSLIDEIAG